MKPRGPKQRAAHNRFFSLTSFLVGCVLVMSPLLGCHTLTPKPEQNETQMYESQYRRDLERRIHFPYYDDAPYGRSSDYFRN